MQWRMRIGRGAEETSRRRQTEESGGGGGEAGGGGGKKQQRTGERRAQTQSTGVSAFPNPPTRPAPSPLLSSLAIADGAFRWRRGARSPSPQTRGARGSERVTTGIRSPIIITIEPRAGAALPTLRASAWRTTNAARFPGPISAGKPCERARRGSTVTNSGISL